MGPLIVIWVNSGLGLGVSVCAETEIPQCAGDEPKLVGCLVAFKPEPVQGIQPHRVFYEPASVDAQETHLIQMLRPRLLKGMGEDVSDLEQPGETGTMNGNVSERS